MDTSLQALLDERDITALLHRYAAALDDRDWDRLGTCFRDNVVVDYDGIARCDGYEEVEQVCRAALGPLSRTQHLIGNVQAVVEGDTARAQCYLQAQHVREGTDGGELFVIAGRYTDTLTRTGDGWRIATRRLETWWTDGNPAVVGR